MRQQGRTQGKRASVLLIALLASAMSIGANATVAGTTEGTEAYDLLFRNNTLDTVNRAAGLSYQRAVSNVTRPELAERDTGEVRLGFYRDDDSPELARLSFHQQDHERVLASFPASVGNPMIMYFVETVMRDMVETVGGSPYYVRNRIKEALISPAERDTVSVLWQGQPIEALEVTLHPFAEDPNAPRMQGFDAMTLRVVMSEEVPGWYFSLSAHVPSEDQPLYVSTIALDAVVAP